MSLSSKLHRIADVFKMSRKRGLSAAVKTGLNRYRYDHFVSQQLPAQCPTTPYHVQIEPSRVCNLRCKMCEYSYMENKGHIMHLDAFRTILAQFPELTSVDITGIGEPFCNPDFLDILRHAKSRGLRVEFVNNGNLLTEERMDAMIDMAVDHIQFSIDASTKETHEAIRVYSDFDRVVETISTLSRKVERSGRKVPVRHLNYTMNAENADETPQFIELARRVGASEVTFRYMIVFEGSAYNEKDTIETLPADRLGELRDAILSEARRHGISVHLDPILEGTAESPRTCMRPWMNAYVDVFGNLYPCCLVTQRNQDISRYALGNLLTDRLEDIWNDRPYRALREGIAHPTRIPEMCEGCAMLKKANPDTEKQLLQLN